MTLDKSPTDNGLQRAYTQLLSARGLIWTTAVQILSVAAFAVIGSSSSGAGSTSAQVVWQVHAAFASIGFAGLAIAFQVLGDPPLTASSARRAVVTDMRFGHLLISGVLSSALIGLTSIWLANPWTVIAAFGGIFMPSVLLVGAAYARLALLFTSPQWIEELTLGELSARVEQSARAAAAQELVSAQEAALIDDNPGLTSSSLPGGPDLPVRTVQFPHHSGRIASLRVGPMKFAADYLAWAARRYAPAPLANPPEQWISVNARSSKHFRTGGALFRMYDWPGIDADTWEAIKRQLLNSVTFTFQTVDDARDVFERDMSELHDSVLAAIRDAQPARLRRGFAYYQKTIFGARRAAGISSLGLRDPRWFERQIYEIDVAAARANDRLALVAIDDAAQMAYDALRDQDLSWLTLATRRLQYIWSALVKSPPPQGGNDPRESLLVSLQNLAEFAAPRYFEGDTARLHIVARDVTALFAVIAKDAIDVGAVSTTERALGYLGTLYDLTSPDQRTLAVIASTSQAAALAWMLMLLDNNPAHPAKNVSLDAFPQRYNVPDALDVLRLFERLRDEAPWTRWESRDALPLRSYVVRFDSFFRRAVAILEAPGRLKFHETPNLDDEEHLRLLRSSLANKHPANESELKLRECAWPNWVNEKEVQDLLKRVQATLAAISGIKSQELAATELDPARVDEFYAAIVKTISDGPSLRRFLSLPLAEAPLNRRAVIGQVLQGLPRYYFVDTDVLASPESLGSEVGAAVLRSQDSIILQALVGQSEPEPVEPDNLHDRVAEVSKSMTDPVVVYNGDPHIENLLNLEFTETGKVRVVNLPGFSVFVPDPAFPGDVVLIDRIALPTFSFTAEDGGQKANLVPLGGAALGVGIAAENETINDDPALLIEYGQDVGWTEPPSTATYFQVTHPTDATP